MRFPLDRVRHSFRTLARNKHFSALAILSLAIAVALNTTMYSVLDAMINPKLAMREPERLYDRYDSWLFGIVALLLFGVTLVASYIPARRAMRINPVEALKND